MPESNPSALARDIVKDIFAEAKDRSGILDGLEKAILDEIRDTWTEIVQTKLAAAAQRPKRWKYFSTNLLGNAHDAVRQINDHPEWDVICMSFDGENGTPGSVTLVVHREEIIE